jgi:hypothetical protein
VNSLQDERAWLTSWFSIGVWCNRWSSPSRIPDEAGAAEAETFRHAVKNDVPVGEASDLAGPA